MREKYLKYFILQLRGMFPFAALPCLLSRHMVHNNYIFVTVASMGGRKFLIDIRVLIPCPSFNSVDCLFSSFILLII